MDMDRLMAGALKGAHTTVQTAWSQTAPPMPELRRRFRAVSGIYFAAG
jgi:hypothetical protein